MRGWVTPQRCAASVWVQWLCSSMAVGIRVLARDIRERVVRRVVSCFSSMVAVDDDRRPVEIAPLALSTPDEHRRKEAAQVRKAMRREMEARFAALRKPIVNQQLASYTRSLL